MSTMDWVLVAVQGLVVIAFIALGVRSGGIGLGLWGGVGTLVLVFLFGLDPGEPPISAILIIIAVFKQTKPINPFSINVFLHSL
jgi:anaerobic C4-dicarboxylate transporter